MSHPHPHEEDRPEADAEIPPWILRLRAITESPVSPPDPQCDPDNPEPATPFKWTGIPTSPGCNCRWATWHATQTQRAIEAAERQKRIAEGFKNNLEDLAYTRRHGLETDRKTRIPRLKPHNTAAYIGAVAQAVARGELDQSSANRMLYAAQLAISNNRNNPTPPPTPPSRPQTQEPKRGKKP